jgi:hypothetical protein
LLSDADFSHHAVGFRGFSDSTQAFKQSDHFQILPRGRDVEWCPIVRVYWADVRPELSQELDKFVSVEGHCVKKGRAAASVSGFNDCSSFDQQIGNFDTTFSSSPHEASKLVLVSNIWINAAIQVRRYDVCLTGAACLKELIVRNRAHDLEVELMVILTDAGCLRLLSGDAPPLGPVLRTDRAKGSRLLYVLANQR